MIPNIIKLRCISIALIISLLQLLYTFYKNHFVFAYGLDDTYIHLAIAKHFAEDGVWGVTQYGFTSATSSPIYTFLLAVIIKIIGDRVWIPLILNIIAVISVFYISADYLYKSKRIIGDIFTLILTLITPIPFLIIAGMEHIFHILAVILLLRAVERENITHILLFSVLSVAIRYESMFLVAGLAFMYFYTEKKIKLPALMLIGGFIPVCIWGFISVRNGAFFFPNPLLMKSTLPSLDIAGLKIFIAQVYEKLKLGMLLNCMMAWLFVYIFAKKQENISINQLIIPIALLINILVHSVLAGNFIVSRYESYMVFAVLLFTLPYMVEKIIGMRSFIMSIAAIIVFYPFCVRLFAAIPLTNVCSKNIYEQQIQVARFLKENYPNGKVFAQDIGAIGYYTDVAMYDVMGLSTNEPIRYKRDITALRKNLQAQPNTFAIFWDDARKEGLPWKYVGRWTISENMICAGKDVVFLAKDTTITLELERKLQNFSDKHKDLFDANYK